MGYEKVKPLSNSQVEAMTGSKKLTDEKVFEAEKQKHEEFLKTHSKANEKGAKLRKEKAEAEKLEAGK